MNLCFGNNGHNVNCQCNDPQCVALRGTMVIGPVQSSLIEPYDDDEAYAAENDDVPCMCTGCYHSSVGDCIRDSCDCCG